MVTETNLRRECNNYEEQKPVCQRESCPAQGTGYDDATRRVTLQLTEATPLPATLHGLSFPDRQITVDLCVVCYHVIKCDCRFQILHVVGIGVYKRA